jgi:hypothetical protein
VSAAIGGLGATSTYHYRVVATTDGGTSRGSDAQFTTQSPPTTQPAAAAGVTPPVAASPAAKLAVACSGRKLALLDVVRHGARVALLGAADASLIGQRVSIRYDDRKAVANVIIAADGFFRATAPLPPKAVRATNHARYVAVAGGQRSLFLKLTRRVVLQPPTAKAGKVTLTGTVLPPLTRPSAPIVVKQQVSCSKAAIVARTRPRRGGGFKVSVPAPRGAQAALYRVETAVRKTTRNPRSYPSFSLPQVVALQP